ncbi:MAG: rhomboid family intramembrane serine protease [Paludibacteraceae bacterium]|nr:rhomboid family intramembrane serine protease [Paludibacteraceae bacterium]
MVTTIIIIVTVIVSVLSFGQNEFLPQSLSHPEWFDKLKFNAYLIVHKKEHQRLLSSGFVHGSSWHLIFNMLTLYFFGYFVEDCFIEIFGAKGEFVYALMYLLAIVVSSLSDLIKHKDDPWFNAIGASGAVSAVIFAAILLDPKLGICFFFIPIPIPGYIFGPLYLIYCQYMAKKNIDNIGHSAHFWGAVFGFVFPILLCPTLFKLFLSYF